MNQESTALLDWHVHKHRIKEEAIFQRLIKEPALEKCEVGVLKELSRELYVLLSNIDLELESKDSVMMITDDIANSKKFITNIMTDFLFRDRKEKEDV